MRHGMQCERVQTFERSERGLMMIVVRPKPHIMIYKQPRLMPKKLPTHSFGCLLADWYEDWGLGGGTGITAVDHWEDDIMIMVSTLQGSRCSSVIINKHLRRNLLLIVAWHRNLGRNMREAIAIATFIYR